MKGCRRWFASGKSDNHSYRKSDNYCSGKSDKLSTRKSGKYKPKMTKHGPDDHKLPTTAKHQMAQHGPKWPQKHTTAKPRPQKVRGSSPVGASPNPGPLEPKPGHPHENYPRTNCTVPAQHTTTRGKKNNQCLSGPVDALYTYTY